MKYLGYLVFTVFLLGLTGLQAENRCRSYSDPNILTFDQTYYQFHLESDHFILFDNLKDTRVTVGYEKSGERSTRNCALYVKKGRRVLFVDFCKPVSFLAETRQFYGVWVDTNKTGLYSIRDPPKCPIITVDQEDSETAWNNIDKYIGNFKCARLQGSNYFDTYIIRTVERHFADQVKIKVTLADRIIPNIEITPGHSSFNNTGGLCGMWDNDQTRELFVLDRDGVESFVSFDNSEDLKMVADFWKLHSRYNKDKEERINKRCPECFLMAERSFYCPCDDFNLFDNGNYNIKPPNRSTYCKVPMGLCLEKYIYNKNDSCLPPLPTTTTTEEIKTTYIQFTDNTPIELITKPEPTNSPTNEAFERTTVTDSGIHATDYTIELITKPEPTNSPTNEVFEGTTEIQPISKTTGEPIASTQEILTTLPEEKPITIEEAKEICENAILKNPVINHIIQLELFDPNFTLESCANDVFNANDASAVFSNLYYVLDLVINILITNPDKFEEIDDDFLSYLCVNQCSGNGKCVFERECLNSTAENCLSPIKCECDKNFGGRDCSKDLTEIPQLDLGRSCCDLRNETCDLIESSSCEFDSDQTIYVKIELIEETTEGTITKAEFTTAERLPGGKLSIKINGLKDLILFSNINNKPTNETLKSSTAWVKVYISYTNNAFSQFSSMVLYDSLCRECKEKETSLLIDKCEIEGVCYKYNDTWSQNVNYVCDPDEDQLNWTFRDPLCNGKTEAWSQWFNLDSPDGDGDLELFGLFSHKYGCANPSVTVIETLDGVPYNETGQVVSVKDCYGFVCLNKQNKDGCLDYHLKQCCPIIKPTTEQLLTTESVKPTKEQLLTTESVKPTTEQLLTTESVKSTTEQLLTTESVKPTKEQLLTTESVKPTKEQLLTTETTTYW